MFRLVCTNKKTYRNAAKQQVCCATERHDRLLGKTKGQHGPACGALAGRRALFSLDCSLSSAPRGHK